MHLYQYQGRLKVEELNREIEMSCAFMPLYENKPPMLLG